VLRTLVTNWVACCACSLGVREASRTFHKNHSHGLHLVWDRLLPTLARNEEACGKAH